MVITQRLSNERREGGRKGRASGTRDQIGWKEIAQIIRRTSERAGGRGDFLFLPLPLLHSTL